MNASSTVANSRQQIHGHLSHATTLIKDNKLPEAITYLDENVPRTIINKLNVEVYHIEKEADRITKNHRDFGRVAFRKLDGFDMADDDRIAAIVKVQNNLEKLLSDKSKSSSSPKERQILSIRENHCALISKIQKLFDANTVEATEEAMTLFKQIAIDKQSEEVKQSVNGLLALRNDELRIVREWHRLDKLSLIHTRVETAYSHLSSESFNKEDEAKHGKSPALLLAAYCKKYPLVQPYLHPLQKLTEIDIEAECKALDNRDAIKKDPLLREDYEKLSSIGRKEENAKLNGFSTHIFDATLVPLSTNRFINANFVRVMDSRFIGTQAPLPETAQDFWQMVLDHNLTRIAAVNDCFDEPRDVIAYCPSEVGSKLEFGDITIELKEPITAITQPEWKLDEKSDPHGIKHRKLIITKGDQTHEVDHFQYINWPDGHIPVTPCVLRFMEMIAENQGSSEAPIVVHCRAGVGRTGLFMVLYDQWMRMKANQPLDIMQSVSDLRDPTKGRSLSMMQNPSQYKFTYEFLSNQI